MPIKFAQGCVLYTFLSQSQRNGVSTYVCRCAGVLPCPLQAKKKHPQTLTSGSFIELLQKYKDNTMPQSLVSSNGPQCSEVTFSFYLRFLNTLQTLTKPCSPFMKSTVTPITQQTKTDNTHLKATSKETKIQKICATVFHFHLKQINESLWPKKPERFLH